MTIILSGDDALRQKLDALGEVGRGQTAVRALVAGALIVQNAAKVNAPYRTGNLRRSIHIGGHEELAGDYNGILREHGERVPDPEIEETRAAVYVGTNVEYAAQREYGGTIVAKRARYLVWQDDDGNWRRARSVHQKATPYLRPAIDENQDAVRREVGTALAELVRAAVR